MTKDNNLKGIGNSLDFGARIYDSRLGRWLSLDPMSAKYPSTSPYTFVRNNPIIRVDPDGNTDFYFNGKFVATDNVPNGIIGLISNKELKDEIKKSSSENLAKKYDGIENGSSTSGVFGVHIDVLKEAVSVLNKALTQGSNREFASTMVKKDGGFETIFRGQGELIKSWDDKVASVESPTGDVSIHSHLTGSGFTSGGTVGSADASNPSGVQGNMMIPGDYSQTFPNQDMNIIVGKHGKPSVDPVPDGRGGMKPEINDNRPSIINFYDKGGNRKSSLTGGNAQDILKSNSKRHQ